MTIGAGGRDMPESRYPRYPKNAPGDFYVEDGCCITCEAPYHEAPDLIAHDEEAEYPHCYFKRQPETPDEVERAISACVLSCTCAVRYAGNNPKILKKFMECDSASSCDVLEGRTPPEGWPESPKRDEMPCDPLREGDLDP
jgi:hypothetical protein